MLRIVLYKVVILFILVISAHSGFSQSVYGFTLTKNTEVCLKATASIEISGIHHDDTVEVQWSTGQTNILLIHNLSSGEHFAKIKIKHIQDSVLFVKDTTLYFLIEKELCEVQVDDYFSPNDDNYHDLLGVSNTEHHPNFEFRVFNKWGQQVHSQKQTYIPWDGKWNGIDQPDGAYYYVFFYDSENKNKLVKGSVTILR